MILPKYIMICRNSNNTYFTVWYFLNIKKKKDCAFEENGRCRIDCVKCDLTKYVKGEIK